MHIERLAIIVDLVLVSVLLEDGLDLIKSRSGDTADYVGISHHSGSFCGVLRRSKLSSNWWLELLSMNENRNCSA